MVVNKLSGFRNRFFSRFFPHSQIHKLHKKWKSHGKVNIAFMTANGIASVVFSIFVIIDLKIKAYIFSLKNEDMFFLLIKKENSQN